MLDTASFKLFGDSLTDRQTIAICRGSSPLIIINYVVEVQNKLSYINFNNSTKGKAKLLFFVLFTSTYIPKKALFWAFFCATCKMIFLFLLLKALFFSIHLIFFIPTLKLGLWLLKIPKEQLNFLLGTVFIIKWNRS